MTLTHSTIAADGGPAYDDRVRVVCGDPPIPRFVSFGTLTAQNSVIEGSCDIAAEPPMGCEGFGPGTVDTGGGNIESTEDTCQFMHGDDEVMVSAAALNLDVLADNGGPTETHALLDPSIAIEAGIPANCPADDQRGVPRPQPSGTNCDSGAFEAPEPGVGLGLLADVALLLQLHRGRAS